MKLGRAVAVAAVSTALTACASGGVPNGPSAPVAAAAPDSAACATTKGSRDLSSWRRVTAGRFSFCVPPEWKVSKESVSRGSATLRWGSGEHPKTEAKRETIAASAPMSNPRPSLPDVQRESEVIDGHMADVWRNRFGTTYYTGAQWGTPQVWFVGEAQSGSEADIEVTIIRSVRFVVPSAAVPSALTVALQQKASR